MRRADPFARDDTRSTGDLVRAITADTAELVRKEVQLAKQEVIEALTDRAKAAAAMAAAGVLALFAFGFLALSFADAMATGLPQWAARLITGGLFLVLATAAATIGKKVRKHPLPPEQTVRTIKEDIGWAKQQLKR